MSFKGWEKKRITLPEGGEAEAVCPVIVSASRATDIPAFHARWLMEQLRAGEMRRVNPFNANQTQHISFCQTRLIVFWSKNPAPLLPFLPELDRMGFNYYFQFTVNDYEKEGWEPNVPARARRIESFRKLSEMIGKKRVIWRYDPLLVADILPLERLMERVAGVGDALCDFTERLVFSFADISRYPRVRRNLARHHVNWTEFSPEMKQEAASHLQSMNRAWGLKTATCAEDIDLSACGIEHGRCIDDRLIAELFPDDLKLMKFLGCQSDLFHSASVACLKDKGQRKECGCIVSRDIGSYNTCRHDCIYCYACRPGRPETIQPKTTVRLL